MAHALVAVALVLVWCLVEVQAQALLRVVGRSGHQVMVGRRPATAGLMQETPDADPRIA